MTPFSLANPRLQARRGFTLVELLVAMAISAIVVLFLGTMVSSALKSNQTTTDSLIALSAANTAMDLVINDLRCLSDTSQQAVSTTGSTPVEFLQALPDSNFVSNLTGNARTAWGTVPPPVVLMLNTTSAQDSLNSNGTTSPSGTAGSTTVGEVGSQPRAVCYQLYYQDPLGNPPSSNSTAMLFGLYRTVQSAQATFQTFLGSSNLASNWTSNIGVAPVTNAFIVGNVVDFQISFFAPTVTSTASGTTTVETSNPAPTEIYFSRNNTNAFHLTGAGCLIGSATAPPANTGPVSYAEVTLIVLDNTGALKINNGSISLTQAENQYGHTLTRRIPLREPF